MNIIKRDEVDGEYRVGRFSLLTILLAAQVHQNLYLVYNFWDS